ncbi:MAG: ATP-binding protein [Sphingobacteriales bacterium]|nr:ATP-binding protein [Sphingobacteriales bacterium]
MANNNQKQDFGVLYGQKTTEDALLIYSSYDDAQASPQSGDFIVLTPKDEDGVKFLARVEAEIYDEDPIFRNQDKTLIAVHYARISERELSERDKQKMFSYTYKVKILGTFKGDGKDFTTAVRKLPVVSYHARHLTPREISNILNRTNESGTKIGYLCIGETYSESQDVLFDVKKLREKRTMVFAQSGFGKTNLMKVLIYNTISDTNYGKLIFDLNGEYYLNGTKTYGLGSIDEQAIKDNLVVYSDKKISGDSRFNIKGNVRLNMHKHLSIGDILNFGTGFSEVMKSFLYYLEDEQVEDFIANLNHYASKPEELHKKYPDFWKEKDASASKTMSAIKKRLSFLTEESKGLHLNISTLVEDVFAALKQGKTVIIDLSLRDNQEATIISNIFMRKLFENNKREFTSNKAEDVINTVIVVEEAQNVLSDEFVRSNANPFVRVAKEGRKFGLGLVAITQRPSAISEEIRSQAENFFVLHMGNTKDIKALVESNINYGGVISKFVQSETIPGNLYMVSANQSFALPVRVVEFEKLVENKIYDDLKLKK